MKEDPLAGWYGAMLVIGSIAVLMEVFNFILWFGEWFGRTAYP